ncbi:MAG: chorismate-binding protein, partial [Microbacteriaceae bacterium]
MRRSVIRHHMNAWVDPGAVFSALYADQSNCFWLDSGIHALAGMSYLGSGSRVITSSVAEGVVRVEPGAEVRPGSVFDFLATESGVDRQSRTGRHPAVPPVPGPDSSPGWPDGFELGWVGWLGYELRHQSVGSRLADSAAALSGARHPDAALLFVDKVIAFDHARRRVTLLALGGQWSGTLRQWRDEIIELFDSTIREASQASVAGRGHSQAAPSPRSKRGDSAHPARSADPPVPGDLPAPGDSSAPGDFPLSGYSPVAAASRPEPQRAVRWRDSGQEYLAMIRACQAEIRAGNAYQLCLTTQATVDVHPDPMVAYSLLRATSPSHHGGFLRIGGVCLLSSSPERFLSVSEDGVIESKPIKGTRRRGTTP